MIAIMAAMIEEIQSLIDSLDSRVTQTHGLREYHRGTLWGHEAVLVFSRWGKVAAAATATEIITRYGAEEIIFTGVAGSVSPKVSIGEIVVGKHLYQHDMDARPLFELHEIPLMRTKNLETSPSRRETLVKAANTFSQNLASFIEQDVLTEFQIHAPQVLTGSIASGDQFIACEEKARQICQTIPSALCVEMEGAAVAQVCNEYGVPFSVIRTISDSANHSAPIDFKRFVKKIVPAYSREILRNCLC